MKKIVLACLLLNSSLPVCAQEASLTHQEVQQSKEKDTKKGTTLKATTTEKQEAIPASEGIAISAAAAIVIVGVAVGLVLFMQP